MPRTLTLPKAEAKVQIIDSFTDSFRDALDIDPIMLPIEPYPAGASPYVADVFDAGLSSLIDVLVSRPDDAPEFRLVWSDSGFSVKGVCPMCDDVFQVDDGWTITVEIRDGVGMCAVGCGCADLDDPLKM
jgi:hypothetical protein